ncbi:MAG: hypothetical protein EOP54_13395 [Sphingobacteriales bacterium]|nr:MAG: hypothetical protein EOP54_13395 [Sphingobacteriales bacterium]
MDGLPGNVVLSFDFLHDGTAWIGTTEGLSYFDGNRFTNYFISEKPDSNGIAVVRVDNRSRVWIMSNNKLLRFEDGKFEPQATEQDYIFSLFKDNRGVIHVAYLKSGIYKFENDAWQMVLPPPKGLLVNARFSNSGRLYALTTEGIIKKTGDTTSYISGALPELELRNLSAKMGIDDKENIWITSLKGVWLYKDRKLSQISYQKGLSDEQTLDLFVDNYANLWIATNGSGLYKYAESPFSRFDNKLLPNAKSIASIMRRGNKLTLGSYYLGIYELNLDNFGVNKVNLPGLPPVLSSIYQDEEQGMIVSGLNNFVQWNKGKVKPISASVTPPGAAWVNVDDTIWGIVNGGLFKIKNDHLVPVIEGKSFISLTATPQLEILLGATSGILLYHIAGNVLDTISELKNVRVHTLLADQDRWYIGTDDRGLLVYERNTKTFRTIDHKVGLSCNYVYNLLKDQKGQIWVGTGCGIDRIFLDKRGEFQIKSYGKSDGLNGAESNAGASFQDEDGVIWFGTTKGLYRYDATKERVVRFPPYVSLTNIQLFSRDIDPLAFSDSVIPFAGIPYRPVFENDQNSLTFTFRAVCLSAPEKIMFRYQLLGADKEPIETRQNTVTYNQLAPGKYTFVVYASDENGVWHENAYKYSFTIRAMFYQTIWFKVLSFVIIGTGIAYVIYRYSRRKEAQRQRELKLREEEQNKVRQRTAEDFHDEIGNKITRINLLTMMAERKAEGREDLQAYLQQIRQNTTSLYHGSKDIIWALQKESNFLKEALLRIQQNAISLLDETDIQLQIIEDPPIKEDIQMPMDYGRNLILIFKEAINNAMKYSGADRLILRFYEDIDNSIVLELEDNGNGFDPEAVTKGNGLKNMENRAKAIKARFSMHSLTGIGTLIRLRMFHYSFEM